MNETVLNLLLVDDEESVREPLKRHLQADPYGYSVSDVANARDALRLLEETNGRFEVALIDEVLEDGFSGLVLLHHIKERYPQIECILCTGWGMQSGLKALRSGAYRYFAKPFNLEELALTIRFAAEESQGHLERRFLSALVRVSQGLTQTARSDEQMNLAWNFVKDQLDVSSFFIADYEVGNDRLHFPLAYDKGRKVDLPDIRLDADPRDWGLAGYVVKTGKEILWSTLEEQERVCHELQVFPRLEGEPAVSCFCVPLIAGERTLGVLSAQSHRSHIFTPALQNALRALAGQLSVSLENSRLFTEAEQRAKDNEYQSKRIAALEKLAIYINSSMELEEVLTRTCQVATDFFLADHSGLVTFEEDFSTGTVEAEYPDLGARGRQIHLRGIPQEEHLIETREPLNLYDVQQAEGLGIVRDILLNLNIQSILFIPVIGKSRLLGSFSLDSIKQKRCFTEQDIELCQIFASQVAVAIENARHVQELKRLQEATRDMSSVEEPKQVLQRIVAGTKRVLNADAALIWTYDVNQDFFIPEELVAEGIPENQLEELRRAEPQAGRITRRVLENGYVNVTDVSAVQDIRNSTQTILKSLGIRSFQSIRLEFAGEPLGVLHVDYKTARDFGKDERQLLGQFASQAAVVLKRSRLLKQIKRVREAARVVAEVTALGNLKDTLREIVQGAKDVLDCDIVTLYTFDEKTQSLIDVEGVGYNDLENLRPPPEVGHDSSLWRIIELGEPYYHIAETVPLDRLLQGAFVRNEKIRSALGIQLRFGQERVGAMFINYRTLHRFTQDEINDALQFGNQAAVAIHNVQLHERTKRQAETLEGLYTATKAVTGLLTLDEILQQIAEQAWRLAGRHNTYTIIRLVESEVAKVVAVYPPKGSVERQPSVPEIDLKAGFNGRIGVTGRAIRTRNSQLVNDVSFDTDYIPSDAQIQSELAVPIMLGERVLGVINVDSPELRAFDEDDEQTLTSLASYAAIAINNAQFLEKTIGHMETLGLLYETGKSIVRSLAVNEVLTHIVEQALQIIHANTFDECFSHVALFDKEKLRFVASFPPLILEDLRRSIGDIDLNNDGQMGIVGFVASTGQPQKVDEVRKDPHYIPLRIKIQSQLSVPIKIGEQVIGVLSVEHIMLGAFNQEDVKRMELLAAQAALAIQNARRYEDLQKMYQDVQETKAILAGRTALAWTGMISSTWRHAIEKHAITIREQVELLRKDILKFPSKRPIEKRLDMMERLANQILRKPLTAPLSAEEEVQSVHLNAFIQQRFKQLWAHLPYKTIEREFRLELGDHFTIRANPDWLQKALDIVIDNAVDATEELARRKIVVATRKSGRRAVISIGDNGRGIPAEIRERLFREPVTKPKDTKGLGLGLLFAQMILQTYAGEIKIGTTGSKGTTMTIVLPVEAPAAPPIASYG